MIDWIAKHVPAVMIGAVVGFVLALNLYNVRLSGGPKMQRLWHWGSLWIGGPVDHFSATFPSGVHVTDIDPPGRFRVFLASDDLSDTCFDMTCGRVANEVVRRGGHLFMSDDGKMLSGLPTARLHDGKKWRHADGILLVQSPKGRVLAIYRNAHPDDIPQVLADLKL